MQFPGPVEDGLVDGGMMLDPDARVFGGELVKRIGEALLVTAALRLYGQPQHRRRKVERREMVLILVVGVMQHRIEVQLFHLGEGADVAGDRLGNLDGVLAQELIYVRNLEGLARVANEELSTRTHRALMYAQNAQLSHVRVYSNFEHMRDNVSARVRCDRDSLRALARTFEEWRRVAFARVRHETSEDAEQVRDTGAGLGRSEAHGNEMALAQGPLKRVVELLRRDLFALLEVHGHELLVELDHLVHELSVRDLH